jgi:hypothetical protein
MLKFLKKIFKIQSPKKAYHTGYMDGLWANSVIYEKVEAAYKAALEGDMDAVTGYLGEVLAE